MGCIISFQILLHIDINVCINIFFNRFVLIFVLSFSNVILLHVLIWLNGNEGSHVGRWVRVEQPVDLVQGYNELAILSETVGLQVVFTEVIVVHFNNMLLFDRKHNLICCRPQFQTKGLQLQTVTENFLQKNSAN